MILMNLKRCEGGPQLHWVAVWAVSPVGFVGGLRR